MTTSHDMRKVYKMVNTGLKCANCQCHLDEVTFGHCYMCKRWFCSECTSIGWAGDELLMMCQVCAVQERLS